MSKEHIPYEGGIPFSDTNVDAATFAAFLTVLAEGIEEMVHPPESRKVLLDGLRAIAARRILEGLGIERSTYLLEWIEWIEVTVAGFELASGDDG